MTAAATAALSDSTGARIGIVSVMSACATRSGSRPWTFATDEHGCRATQIDLEQ